MTYLLLSLLFVAAEEPYSKQAQKLLRMEKHGILSTFYKEEGKKPYPYGSLMPYALDKSGRPIFLISDLALHTQNVDVTSEASLIVSKPDKNGSIFNGSRVTLLGEVKKVPDSDNKYVRDIYLKVHEEAKDWVDFGDFSFYRMEVKDVYFIGGFGEIDWLDSKEIKNSTSEHQAPIKKCNVKKRRRFFLRRRKK